MYLRLIRDLPFEEKHGATKGRVFRCEQADNQGRGRKAWFRSDVGELCAAYQRSECELFETLEAAEAAEGE